MKNVISKVLPIFAAAVIIIASLPTVSADGGEYLIDGAGLFTESQAETIRSAIESAISASSVDIIIVTTTGTDGLDDYDYLENIYGAGGYSSDFAMLLIVYDAEYDEGTWYVMYDGYAAEAITDYEFENISEVIEDYLWDYDFYHAALSFADCVESAVVDARAGNTHGYLYYHSGTVKLLCALAAAAIVAVIAFIIVSVKKSRNGGRGTSGNVNGNGWN